MEKIKENAFVKKIGFNTLVLLCVMVVLYILFAIATPLIKTNASFVSYSRIVSALNYAYFLGFLALGVTFVIATGGIDFSIGPVMFCSDFRIYAGPEGCTASGMSAGKRSGRNHLRCHQWFPGSLRRTAFLHYLHGEHDDCEGCRLRIYQDTVCQLAPVSRRQRLVP